MEYLFFKQLIENNSVFSIDWILADENGEIIDHGKAVSQLGNFTFEFIRFLLAITKCDLIISNHMTEAMK